MSAVRDGVAGEEDVPVDVILDSRPFCFLCRSACESGDQDSWEDLRSLCDSVDVEESLVYLRAMESPQRDQRMAKKLRETGVKFKIFQCPTCKQKLDSLQKAQHNPHEFQEILELLKKPEEEEEGADRVPFQRRLVVGLREELTRKIEVKIEQLQALELESDPVRVDSEEVAGGTSESESSSDSSPVGKSPKKRKNPRRNLKPHVRRSPEPCPECGHRVKPDRHSRLCHSVSAHPETLFSSLKPPSMTPAGFGVKVKTCLAKEMFGKKGKLQCRRCPITHHNHNTMMAHLVTAHRAALETCLQKEGKRPLPKSLVQCEHCGKHVNNQKQLKIHLASHHPIIIFAPVKPARMASLEFEKFCAHAINHRLPEICARRVDQRDMTEKRVCPSCDKLFGSGCSLVRHVVSGHAEYLPPFLEEQLKVSRE